MPGKNIIKTGARKFLDSLGIHTQEIKSVEIQSDDYNNQGSWHIDKSAKWVGLNKAQVTFDVNSVAKTGDNYKNIILVIDTSGSMSGSKLEKAISDSKELINYALADINNRVAIITFNSTSTIVSEFSNEKDELLQKLDAITVTGCTNYDVALKNVDTIMNGYVKETNRDVVTLFLTDGYPNEDTPNQIGTYATLKEKYPYMSINGIQYEMGTDIIDAIKQITDSQWVADQSTLNNVLFEASVSPKVYEDFIVTDYIDDKFIVNSVDDIKVSIGAVALTEENGLQKIVWNLGKKSYTTGGNAKMLINLTLKEKYAETDELFPTNNKETIESKLSDETTKTVNSTKSPVLKGMYDVVYDTNTPDGCTLSAISNEKYFVYQNVTKKADKLTCDGYLFKGWEIDEKDSKNIVKVNDDIFQMPNHDVTMRATWTKQSIVKSMDGTIYEKPTLYKILKEAAVEGTYAKEYTGGHKDSFTEDGTQKIYHWYAPNTTAGNTLAIEILDKNNVIFAGHCWQMIRTTDTGGVKMIYNGEVENNQCLNTRGTHVGFEQSYYNTQGMSTTYYYGTSYAYDSVGKSFTLNGTITTGEIKTKEYTCKQTSADATCTTLYYVDTLDSGTNYYVLPLNTNSHYSQFGKLEFNQQYDSPADVGYMYNSRYPYQYKNITLTELTLSITSFSSNFYYADTIALHQNGKYLLLNSSKLSSPEDSVGKYTFFSSKGMLASSSVYYIVAVEDSTVYYIEISSGNDLAYYNYTYGDSYTDNGNGTYTINNPTTLDTKDWYTGYSNVENKYVCKNVTNNICSDLLYVTSVSNTTMQYLEVTTLKYAKDFEYKIDTEDGTYKYFLNDDSTVSFWNITDSTNQVSLNDAHYTCFNTTGKCTEISYIYFLNSDTIFYINIKDGKNVEDAKNEMLYNDDVNTTNSIIKTGVEAWYEKYLLEYSYYLEDTIFCNDRSQSNSNINGWNSNGGSLSFLMKFYGQNDLSCQNITDQFSTLNEKARLKYKVGLMSYWEMFLLGNNNIRKTGPYYWLSSPSYLHEGNVAGTSIDFEGGLSNKGVSELVGVRPAISLKPGTGYVDGDGSMANPYIVETD